MARIERGRGAERKSRTTYALVNDEVDFLDFAKAVELFLDLAATHVLAEVEHANAAVGLAIRAILAPSASSTVAAAVTAGRAGTRARAGFGPTFRRARTALRRARTGARARTRAAFLRCCLYL
jgi:hypothetical protein